MNIQNVKVKDLKPYENNPRKNDSAVDAVAASIKEFGFKVPIVVDKENVIIAGHTRLKAAEKLGLKEVPVIVADDLTPEQIKAFRLADNKTAELAGWDFDLLDMELTDIDEIDMKQFEFDVDLLETWKDVDPDKKYNDKGYKDDEEVLSKEELDVYEKNADNFLEKRRVIISFKPEETERVINLLGITDGLKKVVYDLSELRG